MNNTAKIFINTLALDSIYQKLQWYERVELHQIIIGKLLPEYLCDNAYKMAKMIIETDWQPPKMKYPEYQKDLLHFLSADGMWKPIEKYKIENTEVTNLIKKI